MLKKETRKIFHNKLWKDHSNPPQFVDRIESSVDKALKDFVLIAESFDEKQLERIFTKEKLEPFFKALLRRDLLKTKQNGKRKSNDRIFAICCLFLKSSLNLTGILFDNRWAKKRFDDFGMPLREMIEEIYYERLKKAL